eukprot:XP_006247615.1 PREDICTED: 26S proteasome non-ATPase regulatory subunit 12-like [Rattus norvegicus]
MEKKERVEFILEQMRLCLAVKDYIRTQIISKKINTKFFQEENTEKLKLKYYNLMIQLDQHEGSYLSICKHYRAIYDTPCIQAESDKWQQVSSGLMLGQPQGRVLLSLEPLPGWLRVLSVIPT